MSLCHMSCIMPYLRNPYVLDPYCEGKVCREFIDPGCPVFPQEPCRRQKCRLRIEREKEKEALGKTCTQCDDDLYIYMCCAEEKGLCHDCCDDLGVCSS